MLVQWADIKCVYCCSGMVCVELVWDCDVAAIVYTGAAPYLYLLSYYGSFGLDLGPDLLAVC